MKKLLTLSLILVSFFSARSQAQNPVNWIASYKSLSATEGEIIVTAIIEKGWHTYSQKATDDGPLATTFSFSESKQYQLLGKMEESPAHEEFDQAFGAKVSMFSDKAEFKQKVKLNGKGPVNIAFKVEFMCCNNTMCLPPKTVDLTVKAQ
jgi:thiol:disulfide interchange protein DsbD